MDTIVPLGADEAFALVTDFRVHERWIPFTRITTPHPVSEGDEVYACSAWVLGDHMRILELTPPDGAAPGVLKVRKTGPVLLGDAVITVAPLGPDQSHVTWSEDVWLAGPLPIELTRAALKPLLDGMLAWALRGVRRDAAALADVRERRRAAREEFRGD